MTVETSAGQAVIVRREPDGSISLLVGRSGVYVLASLTAKEARQVASELRHGISRPENRTT
jgi:hypothetical protein